MGIIDKLIGNSTELDVQKAVEDSKIESILFDGEEVLIAFKLIRDIFILTNKRIIDVDVKAVTGKKKQVCVIPYSKISYFVVESGGTFDLDSELKVYVPGSDEPFTWDFENNRKIFEICKILSQYTCK